MHAVNLIANAVRNMGQCPPFPALIEDGICAVTGQDGPCLPRSACIPVTNCDQPWFAAPGSNLVSVDVFVAWNYGYRKTGGKRDVRPERQKCWWTDGKTFDEIDRDRIRAMVFNGSPRTPWAAWVTTSYKKHGSIRARVNHRPFGLWAFEERLVDCSNRDEILAWWEQIRGAHISGIGRQAIETLQLPGYLKPADLPAWLTFEKWARPRYQSALFAFLCYLLPAVNK